MTSFPRNDYFFPLMTRVTFAHLIPDIVNRPLPPECQPLALDLFWRMGRRRRSHALRSEKKKGRFSSIAMSIV